MYKMGDKLIIRKDLEVGKNYGGQLWIEAMEPLKDMDYITVLAHIKLYKEWYQIREMRYAITDEMIEGSFVD